MIDVCDLRVGDWVFDGDKAHFPMQVQTIEEDYVRLNFEWNEGDVWESSPKELHGVPLDERILKLSGFKFNGTGLWKKTVKDREVSINLERNFVSIEAYLKRLCDCRCTCHGIKYVHQLQNLYREISGHNLNIKLYEKTKIV